MEKKECANPTCRRLIRTGHIKYCSRCKNVVRQQRHRDKDRKTPEKPFAVFNRRLKPAKQISGPTHASAKPVLTTRSASNVERVRNRPLLVEEKKPPGLGQAPPPPTEEFSNLMAEKKECKEKTCAEVEKQVDLLFKVGRRTGGYAVAFRNLRAIYLHGTTFELAYKLSPKKVNRILEQTPGMQISGYFEDDGWTEYEYGYFEHDPLEQLTHEKSDAEYAREYIDQQPGMNDLKCDHGKSFREECDLCKLACDGDTTATWNQEDANRALAELGHSVWAGKSKKEIPWGRGGSGGILDAGEDTRDRRTRDRKTGKKVNAPDSFERTKSSDDESPFCHGQLDSNPDPDYTGKKSGLDCGKAAGSKLDDAHDPNRQQVDAKQDLTSVDDQITALHETEERISEEAFEKTRESSSEGAAERVMEEAHRKIDALEGGPIAADVLPTEEAPEETPDCDFIETSEES